MSTAMPTRPVTPGLPRDPRPRPAMSAHAGGIDPFRVLRRHLLVIVASMVFGGAIGLVAFFALRITYPLYKGEVLFEILPGVRDVRDVGSSDMIQDQLVQRLSQTESIILTSREVIEAALRDPEVRRTRWFETEFVGTDGGELVEEAVDELEEDLGSSPLRNTNLFALRWSTHHAGDVPMVLNAISRAYLERRRNLDARIYTDNIALFRNQLADTQRTIEDVDQQIAVFIRAHGLGTLQDPRDSQTAYKMRQLAQQITEVQSDLSMTRSAYDQISRKLEGTIEPTSDDRALAEADPAVMLATQQVQQLRTDLRNFLETYQPDNPIVQRTESRLRAVEETREAKIQEILRRNLQAALKGQGDQLEQLLATSEALTEEYEAQSRILHELTASQSQYQSLETKRDYLMAEREADLQLIKEVQLLQLRSDAMRVRLALPALEPRALSFPQPEIIVPLATLLVVSLTVGLIFLRELTDQRVKSASDLAVLPHARLIGMVPDRSEDPTRVGGVELVVRKHPGSVLAESYRQAFAGVAKQVERAGHQTLMIVGGLPGSGTTTVVTNLAATFAATGRKVVCVDANFRRPRLAEAMEVAGHGPGLGDVLAGSVTAAEAIVDAGGGIAVLPAGSPGNRVFELLNTRQFDGLLAELRDRYDLVIFDTPPAVVAGEALVLANKLDASLLVVRANREHRGLVGRLVGLLDDAQCDLLGLLLNRPRGTAGGYFRKNFAAMAAYGEEDRA